MQKKESVFDVAVIGGGPAGIMAGIKAAENGASVVLLEKNKDFGRKLLLTGGGRCNITNAEFDIKKMVARYGKGGRFLFFALSIFGPKEVIDFFNKEKVATRTERGKRVFPKNNQAKSVLGALLKALKRKRIVMVREAKVHRLSVRDGKIRKIILHNKREVVAQNYILCTGGLAYPVTGSTGDGLRWAKSLGHTIKEQEPVLVPLKIREKWVKDLQGLSLKNVQLTVEQEGKKIKKFGEFLFTHYGVSGPIVLEASGDVREFLKNGEVKLFLDLKPALDLKKLDERIQRDFQKYDKKMFKNGLEDLLPAKMIPVVISLSGIARNKKVNEITKEERKRVVNVLKKMEMTVDRLMGFNLAITTSGGVSLSEIDQKTMRSKKIENLYLAGEVIDIDGPTGGFNLQMCWSTGYLAGKSAVEALN